MVPEESVCPQSPIERPDALRSRLSVDRVHELCLYTGTRRALHGPEIASRRAPIDPSGTRISLSARISSLLYVCPLNGLA
jgi:hypothetical protein